MTFKVNIHKLQGCPFRHDTNIAAHASCWLYEDAVRDGCDYRNIPEWCPLNKGPVTVEKRHGRGVGK